MSDYAVANDQNQTNTDSSLKAPSSGQSDNTRQKVDGDVGGDAFSAKEIKIGEKNKIINNYFSKGDKSFKITRFSVDDAIPLSAERLDNSEQTFIYPLNPLEDLRTCLNRYRMLLLTGEPGAGKKFTTISLANFMIKETQKDYEIKLYESFMKRVDIDPMSLIKTPGKLKGKIIIFKDVFSTKNQGLMDFFRSCSGEQTDYISNNLKECEALLLFTADTGTFDPFPLSHLAIKREIHPLDRDLVKKGFDLKLQHFCSLSSLLRDITKATQLLEGKKEEIIDKLGRMPKIAHFIENYLDRILFEGKSIDEALEEALDTRKRLEHLFLKELGANKAEFEAWTFAICLAMFNGISYADFHEIHREMTAFLLKRLDPFRTLKDFTFATSEDNFLDKCGAHIEKDIVTHSYRIEFRNHEDQKVLMDILMQNNRKILLEIIPFLEKYVETHFYRGQRRPAAISLGRLGMLDPGSIIFPIIDKWTILNTQDDYRWENVGIMYEGIIITDDKDYKRYCLRKLDSMAFSDDVDDQWTAIAAYKHIGLHDLEFALEELRKIQEEAIARMKVEQSKQLLDLIYSQDDASNLRDVLKKMDQIYKETAYLISYVRYSIVALSGSAISEPITIDPIDVLHELRKWIHKGNQNSRANVAMFFLGPNGILAELESIIVTDTDEEDKDKKEKSRTNLLLYAMAESKESIKKLTDFLNDLYKKCFPEFRLEIHKEFKKMLFEHMEKWAVESLYNEKVNDALKNLLVRLYQTGNEELKDSLWDSINRWKVPKEEDKKKDKDRKNEEIEKWKEKETKLDAFVNEVKGRIIKS